MKPSKLIFVIILPTILGIASIVVPLITQWEQVQKFFYREKKPPVVVKLGYLPIVTSLATEVAFYKGFFPSPNKKLNLKRVERIPFSTSEDLANALALGEIQVASLFSIVTMVTREANDPGRVRIFSVSNVRSDKPFDAILVPEESSIQKIESLTNQRIGTFPGSTATSILKRFLEERDLPTDNLKFVPIPPKYQLEYLQNGKIDLLFCYEPIVTLGLLKGYRKVNGSVYASLSEPSPCPIGCMAINRKFENDHETLASEIIRAIDRAIMFIREHPSEARPILKETLLKEAQMSEEEKEKVANLCILADYTLSIETTAPGQIDSMQTFLKKLVDLKEIPNINVQEFLKTLLGTSKEEVSEKLEKLPEGIQFPDSLKDKMRYDAEKKLLIFKGVMKEKERIDLLKLSQEHPYQDAVEGLFHKSQIR
ncbi:MAG TPA: ABC transporter substrate-binding protein [Candidatus Hypogeohydataceae bacterium YC41]